MKRLFFLLSIFTMINCGYALNSEILLGGDYFIKDMYQVDINNDGIDDIILLSNSGLFSFEGIQTDSFKAPMFVDVRNHETTSIKRFAHGDMNQDNFVDIVALRDDAEVVWYENDGTGTFLPPVQIAPPANPNNNYLIDNIIVTRLNSDPYLDVVFSYNKPLSTWSYGYIKYALNYGNAVFSGVQGLYSALSDQLQLEDVGDINNDGEFDVLASSKVDKKLFVLVNNQNSFTYQLIDEYGAYSPYSKFVDLDQNQYAEIVAPFSTAIGGGIQALYYNNINGSFSNGLRIDSGRYEYIQTLDFDQDSDLDLILSEGASVSWVQNIGNGQFDTSITLFNDSSRPSDLNNYYGMRYAQFNPLTPGLYQGTIGYWDGTIRSFKYNQNGAFDVKYPWMCAAVGADEIILADVNLDGIQDLISISHSSEHIIWRPGTNSGLGNPDYLFIGNERMSMIKEIDFDLDGDLDLVALEKFNKKLIWIENINGSFMGNRKVLFTTLGTPSDIEVIDMTGDTLPDIVLSSPGEQKLYWLKNLGNGNLLPNYVAVPGTADYGYIQATDFDQDGDIDVFAKDSEIVLFKNDGSNNFSDSIIVGWTGFNGYDFLVEDVNGDQFEDLINFGHYSGAVLFYTPTNGFQAVQLNHPNPNYYGPNFAHVIDINSDGNNELITTNRRYINGVAHDEMNIFNYVNGGFTHSLVIDTINAISDIEERNENGNKFLVVSGDVKSIVMQYQLSGLITNYSAEELDQPSILIYPNPTSDFINIDFLEDWSGNVSIVDQNGRQIKSQYFRGTNCLLSIKDFNLSTGTYYLMMNALDGKRNTRKILVRK
ncbi:MAG: T9SS type A sorting domain-containing protein [Flavobacteriales bacterium]|nr:T9SS type A sorting domain-containing protein [Flavobacteriales bacterium]